MVFAVRPTLFALALLAQASDASFTRVTAVDKVITTYTLQAGECLSAKFVVSVHESATQNIKRSWAPRGSAPRARRA